MMKKNFLIRTLSYKLKAKVSKKVQFKLFKICCKLVNSMPNKTSELYSDILDSHTQGEVIEYPLSFFILKEEKKIGQYLTPAIKNVRNIQRIGCISYKRLLRF